MGHRRRVQRNDLLRRVEHELAKYAVQRIPVRVYQHHSRVRACSPGDRANNIPSISSGIAVGASGTGVAGGGTPPVNITGGVQTPVNTGLSSVSGLAIGAGGTLIIAGTDSTGELQLVTGGSATATFGSVAVGSTGSAVPFSFTVAGGTTISSISVMTMGATGQDFAEASGSTCAAQAYSATTSCTINITVSPAAAGLRMGGLLISSDKGSTFVPLYATGTGPQLAFTPATRSTVLSGLSVISRIDGLAVDGSGNLYVGGSNAAEKATLAGGTYGSTSKLDTSLTSSAGEAVDGGGNVYISGKDNGSAVIVRLQWTGSGYGTPATLPFSGLSDTDIGGVAVDSAGNVYYTDVDNNRILMVPWDSATQTYGTPEHAPIYGCKFALGRQSRWQRQRLCHRLHQWNHLKAAAEQHNKELREPRYRLQADLVCRPVSPWTRTAMSTSPTCKITVWPRYPDRYGRWRGCDGGQRVVRSLDYGLRWQRQSVCAQWGTSSVIKVYVSTPPSISFPTSTPINTADATDNPQHVTLENVGNESLSSPIPGSGKNPSVTGAFFSGPAQLPARS